MTGILRMRLSAAMVLAVIAAVPIALQSSRASASPGPNAPTQVPSGFSPVDLPGVQLFGDTPSTQVVTVSFVLQEQNMQSLEAQVDAGIPSSQYLSVGQFANQYGQPTSNIRALTSYLQGYGIQTNVYADDLDVVATGTVAQFDSALTVTERNATVPAQRGTDGFGAVRQQNIYTNTQPPLLPYRLASFVTAILGLSDYGPFVSDSVPASSHDSPQTGNSNSCTAEFGLSGGCLLPSNFAKMYDLDPLYARANGSGETVGIVTLAPVDPGAPQYFWSNIAHVNRTGSFSVDSVDGGGSLPPSGSVGSDETDLDVEQSGSLAPGANVIAYEAPNTDYGFADAFFTAASQNMAGSVSASWGESETDLAASILSGDEAAGYQQAFDEAFLEMAAQGQSAFTSSADNGAYIAQDTGTTNLSVDDPGDSPYITACGATSLPGTTYFSSTLTATTTTTRIWGWDYLWPAIAQATGETLAEAAETDVVGSGGGFSMLESTPSYQQNVSGTHNFHAVEYLTPTDYETIAPGLVEPTAWNFNPTPSVTSGFGNGRAVPDLATDGDPQTGYLVYGASVGGLNEFGGTSFVAPQLNGSTAVIDSYLGHRVGFWNPTIYAAASSFNSPFTQVNQTSTSNDNIYYTGNPCQVYNEGVGLGQPDLAKLAGDFGYRF
ncbi:MAG: S53 family peptidase [Acidimicrobiales bacterium]